MGYGTLSAWRAYSTARGDNAPTATSDALASAALLRGTDYIQFTYVPRFAAGYDSTAANVEFATYESAARELATPGFWSKTFTASEAKVLVGVGDLRWQVTGSTKDARSMAPTSTRIEALLWPYLARSYGAVVV